MMMITMVSMMIKEMMVIMIIMRTKVGDHLDRHKTSDNDNDDSDEDD